MDQNKDPGATELVVHAAMRMTSLTRGSVAYVRTHDEAYLEVLSVC